VWTTEAATTTSAAKTTSSASTATTEASATSTDAPSSTAEMATTTKVATTKATSATTKSTTTKAAASTTKVAATSTSTTAAAFDEFNVVLPLTHGLVHYFHLLCAVKYLLTILMLIFHAQCSLIRSFQSAQQFVDSVVFFVFQRLSIEMVIDAFIERWWTLVVVGI
jgi:hypothetical protein